jgi:hypothetical protein
MWDPTPLNWSRLCGIGLAKTGVRYVGRNRPIDVNISSLLIEALLKLYAGRLSVLRGDSPATFNVEYELVNESIFNLTGFPF